MSVLSLKDFQIKIADQALFEPISLTVEPGDLVSLEGETELVSLACLKPSSA